MDKELTVFPETAMEVGALLREATLNHDAFDQKVAPCSLVKCKATCCYDGVYLGVEEAETIKHIVAREAVKGTWERYELEDHAGGPLSAESIISETPEGRLKTQVRSAMDGELADDFPTHYNRTRCVFLDTQGRCGLQRLAMEEGDKHPWFYKPLTCWIHPIAIAPPATRGGRAEITLYNEENDPHRGEGFPGFCSVNPCGRIDLTGVSAKEALKDELDYLSEISGRPLQDELNAAPLY